MFRRSRSSHVAAHVSALLAATLIGTAGGADAETEGELFETASCVLCHGENGDGRGPVAPAIPNPKPRNFGRGKFKFDADEDGYVGADADLQQVIRQGALAFGGSSIMMPNPSLSEDDIASLVRFLRSFKR